MRKIYYTQAFRFDIISIEKKQKILSCLSSSCLYACGHSGENRTCYEDVENGNFFLLYFDLILEKETEQKRQKEGRK